MLFLTSLPVLTLASLALSPSVPVAGASSSHLSPRNPSLHHQRFDRVHRSASLNTSLPLDSPTVFGGEASLATWGDEADQQRLAKRGYSGRATFYATGQGACGAWNTDSDYIVALNADQYGDLGAVSKWCFQTITISYGGKSTQAKVMDACPGCPYGGLDMSPGLFKYFASESVGVFYMTWEAGDGAAQTTTTTTTQKKTTTTTSYKPTTTWTPTTTTTTWSPEPTTTTTTQPPPTTTTTTTTTTSSSSSSSSSSRTSSSSASSTSGASSATSTTAPDTVGGNLDGVAQLVIALGNLVGAAAQAAQ
ncbi:hypothetical protein JCM8547_004594 [Rhodosporidiobolus lusitaniae]